MEKGQEKVVLIKITVKSANEEGTESTSIDDTLKLTDSAYFVKIIGVEQTTTSETTTAQEVTTASGTKGASATKKEVVNPSQTNTKIKKVFAKKKALKVKLKKVKTVKGYQVQVATNKKFTKNKKSVKTKNNKKVQVTIRKLKSKVRYFVRVRTYKIDKNATVYSKWTKAKKKKTK